MNFTISDKMSALKPSLIREFFKYASQPGIINLSAGSPAIEALPVEAVNRILGEIMAENPVAALPYSISEGHPPFREMLRGYLDERYGIVREPDQIMITTGAQQCMDLAAKVLCNEGDTVICETPSFTGSLNSFRSYGANLVGIPLEEDGMDIGVLEKALKTSERVRFLYLIPNFQNPSGITTSLEKRKAVYALARKYDTAILEDNPYGDLRFTGEHLPTFKSMDEDGRVLYAGTFSKIISPGVRVGYLVAPDTVFGKLVVAKQCADVHTTLLSQLLCMRFLEETDMDRHLDTIRQVYARKSGLMLGEMERRFPEGVRYTRPEGGLFIWITLPDGMDGAAFADRLAYEKKVAVVPGAGFGADLTLPSPCFRVTFSTPPDEDIVEGIARIGDLIREIRSTQS